MKIILSFLLFLMSVQSLTAQAPETFIVDSTSMSVKQTLPFDRAFILGFRGPSSKSIYSAFLFEWVIRGNARRLKQRKDSEGKLKLVFEFIKPENVFNLENGSDVYIPAQPPSKNFAILLAHRFDADLLNEALKASWYKYKSDAANAAKVLNGLNGKVEGKIKPVPGIPLTDLKDISAFGSDWVDPQKGAVMSGNDVDVNASIVKGFNNFYNAKLVSFYNSLSLTNSPPISLTTRNVFIVVQAANTVKLSTIEFGPLVSLLSRSMQVSLLEGKVALQKDLLSSQVESYDLIGRLKNLNTSLTEIERLRQYCELAQAQLNNNTLVQLIADLGTISSNIEKNRDQLKVASAGVLRAIAEDVNFVYNNWAFGHNEVWDLKIRGSYQVIPDIGISTIFAIGNEKSEVIVRPYLGANIYFRPVDKNVPFKYFDRKYRWLHRLSASVGVTVGKVDQGEFSDFFGSMNLLTGANYKITRELSVSAGMAFLKRANANKGIDDKTTTVNPYLGISFDLDFTHAIQKLTGKFSL